VNNDLPLPINIPYANAVKNNIPPVKYDSVNNNYSNNNNYKNFSSRNASTNSLGFHNNIESNNNL
jgi:hypothetical protein